MNRKAMAARLVAQPFYFLGANKMNDQKDNKEKTEEVEFLQEFLPLALRQEDAAEFADRIYNSTKSGVTEIVILTDEDDKILRNIMKDSPDICDIFNGLMENDFSEFKIGMTAAELHFLQTIREMEDSIERLENLVENAVIKDIPSITIDLEEEGVRLKFHNLELEEAVYILDETIRMLKEREGIKKEPKDLKKEQLSILLLMKGISDLEERKKINKEREEKRKKGFKK